MAQAPMLSFLAHAFYSVLVVSSNRLCSVPRKDSSDSKQRRAYEGLLVGYIRAFMGIRLLGRPA